MRLLPFLFFLIIASANAIPKDPVRRSFATTCTTTPSLASEAPGEQTTESPSITSTETVTIEFTVTSCAPQSSAHQWDRFVWHCIVQQYRYTRHHTELLDSIYRERIDQQHKPAHAAFDIYPIKLDVNATNIKLLHFSHCDNSDFGGPGFIDYSIIFQISANSKSVDFSVFILSPTSKQLSFSERLRINNCDIDYLDTLYLDINYLDIVYVDIVYVIIVYLESI
ncbi:hypothetical protein Daus18300_009979 [Diaporthe australafricana]|uniref:Uncharacterized protein n=1 Tax=Diaporthe australafricana TaxID=127596 RepID=A0ABR3WC31_9PEZI